MAIGTQGSSEYAMCINCELKIVYWYILLASATALKFMIFTALRHWPGAEGVSEMMTLLSKLIE